MTFSGKQMELYIDILGQKNTAHFLSHVVAIKVEIRERLKQCGEGPVSRRGRSLKRPLLPKI